MYFYIYFQCTFQWKVPNKYTFSILISSIFRIWYTYLVLFSITSVLILYLFCTQCITGVLILYFFWTQHFPPFFGLHIFLNSQVYLFCTLFGLSPSLAYFIGSVYISCHFTDYPGRTLYSSLLLSTHSCFGIVRNACFAIVHLALLQSLGVDTNSNVRSGEISLLTLSSKLIIYSSKSR